MTRLVAIGVLILIALFLIRYGTNEKLQKAVIVTVLSSVAAYIVYIMATELLR
jgi:hypothetical protein